MLCKVLTDRHATVLKITEITILTSYSIHKLCYVITFKYAQTVYR